MSAKMMTAAEINSWLGKYMLIFFIFFGGAMILLSDTSWLPLGGVATSCAEIMLPLVIAQLGIIFSWSDPTSTVKIERWKVIGPPIGVGFLLLSAALMMGIGNYYSKSWTPSPAKFQLVVVLCVSLLSATTVYWVGKLFAPKA